MANRLYTSQFLYNFERQMVKLVGQISQSSSVGAFATLVNNGITWTAVTMGSAGNSITVALVAGGTAGSEVVTVSGNAISVSIQSGVSTRTQVLTAVQASAAASALVSISVASGATAATAISATALATGADTSFSQDAQKGFTLTQTGTGIYTLTLANSYAKLLDINIMIQKASATDIKPQIISSDVTSAKTIVFRTIAVATPTNLASGDVLFIGFSLRNSANVTPGSI